MAAPNRGHGPFTSDEIEGAGHLLCLGDARAQRASIITVAGQRPADAVGKTTLVWTATPNHTLDEAQLYHCTNKKNLANILAHGLVPSISGTLGSGIYLAPLSSAMFQSSVVEGAEVVLAVKFAPNGTACYRPREGMECAVGGTTVVAWADVTRGNVSEGRGPRYHAERKRLADAALLASASKTVKDGIDLSQYLHPSDPSMNNGGARGAKRRRTTGPDPDNSEGTPYGLGGKFPLRRQLETLAGLVGVVCRARPDGEPVTMKHLLSSTNTKTLRDVKETIDIVRRGSKDQITAYFGMLPVVMGTHLLKRKAALVKHLKNAKP
jgi:hypothetical protein